MDLFRLRVREGREGHATGKEAMPQGRQAMITGKEGHATGKAGHDLQGRREGGRQVIHIADAVDAFMTAG